MSDARDHAPQPNGTHYDLNGSEDRNSALEKIKTAGSISISPELFEKIYLSPKNQVEGGVRKFFGNPTPICLGGFLLALTPLSNVLLEWRGSGGLGAAETGAYFFFGGLLMVVGGFMEVILGNTFPAVVFTMFGGFWFTFGATLVPFYNAATAYGPEGAMEPQFAASFGFFLLYMGLLSFIFMIVSLRTNIVFFGIFLSLVPAFGCLAGAFWKNAEGNTDTGLTLQHAGGGLTFVTCIFGWYIFTAQLLAAVDFPINLPVGDLSHIIKGGSQRYPKDPAGYAAA